MKSSANDVVKLGMLRFAGPGESFASRKGIRKNYLIDTRGAGTNLELRELVVGELVRASLDIGEFDAVCGVAKSGTVWGAWVAWMRRLPFANVLLDGPRASGLQREVEGDVKDKDVILIDNWVRTGESLLKAKDVVERNGGRVTASLVITKHGQVDVPPRLYCAWDLEELFEASRASGLVEAGFRFI